MLDVVNPATGNIEMTLEEDSAETVREKYLKAKAAQPAWNQKSFSARAAHIQKFSDLLTQRTDECARILTLDMGKPLGQATGEIKGTVGRIGFFLEHTASRLAKKQVFADGGMEEVISFEPLGVVANISAWNYPWFVGSNVFIPALLTGNTVLYKPSEFTPRTGQMIANLAKDAGIPQDVFQCVSGGPETGSALLKQDVDGVFFTGSHPTGMKISQQVAGRMIRLQMELGGKDPVYVRSDVDPVIAAQSIADGAFYNAGQSCCAVERVYVQESSFDKFVEEFVLFARNAKVGNPLDEGTYIGPLTRKAQLKFLEDQVADAVNKGAKVLTGGKRIAGDGFYFEPTVLVDVDHSMRVMTEESFGPIIGIMKVRDDAEALKLMNDTRYGLTAGVFSKNRNAAEAILSKLNSGSVYWNCCDRVSPRLPWSGRGWSGIGSTLSYMGIDAFVQPKAWHMRVPV